MNHTVEHEADPFAEPLDALTVALDELDATPCRAAFLRAARVASGVVDELFAGRRIVTASFAANGPALLERFTEWTRRFLVAQHEAGHAVASWAVGRRLVSATIVPAGEVLGCVRGEERHERRPAPEDVQVDLWRAALVALAGDIAEHRLRSEALPGRHARRMFALSLSEDAPDWQTTRGLAWHSAHGHEPLASALIAQWRADATALLDRYRAQLELVAATLIARRTLGEHELDELLGPSPGQVEDS